MNIYIPDHLSPKKRKDLLSIYPIIYALHMHDWNLIAAADFLGMSRKGLYSRITKYKIMQGLLNCKRAKIMEIVAVRKPKDPIDRIRGNHIRKVQNSFWYHQLNPDDQREAISRIINLYSNLKR